MGFGLALLAMAAVAATPVAAQDYNPVAGSIAVNGALEKFKRGKGKRAPISRNAARRHTMTLCKERARQRYAVSTMERKLAYERCDSAARR